MKTNDDAKTTLLFVGDSDISNWPSDFFPTRPPEVKLVSDAVSGAKLSDLIPMVHSFIINITRKESRLIVVACAGENDISSGRTVTKTLKYFDEFLSTIFHDFEQIQDNKAQCNIIFFGPKFEPWLQDDFKYRKKYRELSDGMKKACHDHPESKAITFVDCLYMFCDKNNTDFFTPDKKYFQFDELHLSKLGYQVWKDKLESELNSIYG